ncbi:MAG: hypothetical protein ACLTWO_12885 [Blautia massiliensis (ex Durand et al. 2017)]
MEKSTIPGTKIIKIVAGKKDGEEKVRKDLEKIGRIERLGKAFKSAFSL